MKLGISVVNDFELLRRIGGECAGALVILPEGEPASHEGRYRPLCQDEIDTAAHSVVPARRLMSGPMRFSLAGRQNKWAVYQDADGAFYAPEGAFASSHLIKFDSIHYEASSWNEAFVTYLARGLDMPVVPMVPRGHYAVIERYDRLRDAQGISRASTRRISARHWAFPRGESTNRRAAPRSAIASILCAECRTTPQSTA